MNIEQIYRDAGAYLQGHFLLSSKKHSEFYLQSAKVLENPKIAKVLANALKDIILQANLKIDAVCSPALGGLIAGYELASTLGVRFIFTERVGGKMSLRRGFEVSKGERFLICEDIITTGGSALECSEVISSNGGEIVGFAALANRGFCKIFGSKNEQKETCKLPANLPFFALGNFDFELYEPENCPLCKQGSRAIKPGSRDN